MTTPELRDHVALVTGGSRGIGTAIVHALAAAGAAVAINFREQADAAQALAAAIRTAGGRAIAVQADVAERAAVTAMFAQTASELGAVDILINNAEGLTRGYAARLVKEGITVNAVAPSLIETDMMKGTKDIVARIPLGRLGTADEVAQAVMLLIANEYMTGQTIAMSGGMSFN